MENFKQKIEEMVLTKKSRASSDSAGTLGAVLGTGIGLFNLPIGLLIVVSGTVYDAIETKKNMDEPILDEWLKMVSDYKEASPEGLAFLAKQLSKKGYVSIGDAADWVDIERKEQEKKELKNAITDSSRFPGAVSLLSRVKKECGVLVNFDAITKAFDLVEKVVPQKTVASTTLQVCRKLFGK